MCLGPRWYRATKCVRACERAECPNTESPSSILAAQRHWLGIPQVSSSCALARGHLYVQVFVANIPHDAKETELRDLFSRCGTITHITMGRDRYTGKFSYVQ